MHRAFSQAVDGFRLAYDRGGQGRTVLLLHGWPGDRSDFAEVARRLDATVLLPDLSGFGESEKLAGGDYSAAASRCPGRVLVPAVPPAEPGRGIGGRADRGYLRHFWTQWSSPGFQRTDGTGGQLTPDCRGSRSAPAGSAPGEQRAAGSAHLERPAPQCAGEDDMRLPGRQRTPAMVLDATENDLDVIDGHTRVLRQAYLD